MSKVTPKISAPGRPKMPNTGGHTDGVQKGGHGRGGSLAKVQQVGKGNPQGRMPLQSPPANVTGTKMPYGGHGQPPAAKGGPAGLRAGGKNQSYPNGPLYTDGSKKGGSGRGGELKKPARRGKGAAFYGEY